MVVCPRPAKDMYNSLRREFFIARIYGKISAYVAFSITTCFVRFSVTYFVFSGLVVLGRPQACFFVFFTFAESRKQSNGSRFMAQEYICAHVWAA